MQKVRKINSVTRPTFPNINGAFRKQIEPDSTRTLAFNKLVRMVLTCSCFGRPQLRKVARTHSYRFRLRISSIGRISVPLNVCLVTSYVEY